MQDTHNRAPEVPPPAACGHCAAVCCREEVLYIVDEDLPSYLTELGPDGVSRMRRLRDGWCAALNRADMNCAVYAQRPLPCRLFEMGGADCVALRARFNTDFAGVEGEALDQG